MNYHQRKILTWKYIPKTWNDLRRNDRPCGLKYTRMSKLTYLMMSENKYKILAEQECVPGWENKIHMSIIIIFLCNNQHFSVHYGTWCDTERQCSVHCGFRYIISRLLSTIRYLAILFFIYSFLFYFFTLVILSSVK